MALIVWSDDLSVKVGKSDEQHKVLINLINDLHDAMLKGKSKEIISDILKSLVDYTVVHFTEEEELLAKYEYPDLPIQKKAHAAFVKRISEFQEGYKKEKFGLSIEIMDFLSDWLRNHINGIDKNYSAYMNSKGVF